MSVGNELDLPFTAAVSDLPLCESSPQESV